MKCRHSPNRLDPKDFCMEATGTPRQSVGFPGANVDITPLVRSLYYGRAVTCVVGDTNMKLTRFPPVTRSTGVQIKSNVNFSQGTERKITKFIATPINCGNWQISFTASF